MVQLSRFSRRHVFYLLLLGLCRLAVGQDAGKVSAVPLSSLDTKSIVVLVASAEGAEDEDGRTFAEAISKSIDMVFGARGMSVLDPVGLLSYGGAEATEVDRAKEAGRSKKIRWVAVVQSKTETMRLAWRIHVYDSFNGALRAADAYTAFPGLTALPIIEDSIRSVAAAWESKVLEDADAEYLVDFNQEFVSKDNGAQVHFGAADASIRVSGRVEKGSLTAPFVPFRQGDPVLLEVTREGYWPASFSLPQGLQPMPIELPRLWRKTQTAWGVNAGLGRLPGAALSFRWYPDPDRFFIKAENAFWVYRSFIPGTASSYRNEFRIGPGLYLQSRKDVPFRYAVGTGLSFIGTWLTDAPGYRVPMGFDILCEPLWFTLEYHFYRWAFVFEQRIPYSFGAENGFLEQGWLELNNAGPLFFSLGVMVKW